jgi:hypothetical protein
MLEWDLYYPPLIRRGSSRRQNHPRSAGETILVANVGKHWARLVPLDSEGRTSAWRYPPRWQALALRKSCGSSSSISKPGARLR